MDNFREWLSDNLRYILLGLAIILVLGIAIFVVRMIGGSGGDSGNSGTPESINIADTGTETATDAAGTTESSASTEAASTEALTEDNADILAFVQNYYTAMQNKDLDTLATLVETVSDETKQKVENTPIESYNNIKVYSLNGPAANSYVVYVYYEAKVTGVDTLVPSMSSLYLKTKDDGSLYASGATEEEQTQINALQSNANVKALIDDVRTKYDAVLKSDANLQSVLGDMGAPETESVLPDASTTGVEANKVVMCLEDDVNVRTDSTTTADIIGTLSKGATVTRIQALDNGWSEIRYGDQTAYVSSQFLTEDLNALDAESATEAQ